MAPLWVHLVGLTVLLLALLPVMQPAGTFTSDEGAYALQERSLAKGSWAYDYRASNIDPAGRYFPLVLATSAGGRFFTYVAHPAYPVLMRAGTAVAGPIVGLHVPALVGVMLAAMSAWLLAEEVAPSVRRLAFWAIVASPVLVNGYLLWAHSLSAGIAGLTAVAAVRGLRRGLPIGSGALVAVGLAAGVLLRSEAVLFACALVTALMTERFVRDGLRPAATAAALTALPVAVVILLERRWSNSILGSTYDNLSLRGDTSSYFLGRITGAWHELFQAHHTQVSASWTALLGLALFAGLGAWVLRSGRAGAPYPLGIAAAAVLLLYGYRYLHFPREPFTGLWPAWPLALLGILVLRWRGNSPATRLLITTSALFTAGLIMTQYPEGGGFEWGGRLMSPIAVPLAVLAVAAVADRVRAFAPPDNRRAAAVIMVVALATGALGLASAGRDRARYGRIVAAVSRHPAQVTVTTALPLPRIAWATHDRLSWMLTEQSQLWTLLTRLRADGVQEVAVVTGNEVTPLQLSAYPGGEVIEEPALEEAGLRMFVLRS